MSYINGLHPEKNGDLHKIIEQIVGKAIPMWDAMFGALMDEKMPRIVTTDICYGGSPVNEDGCYISDFSELPVVHPEPPCFEQSEWLRHQKVYERKAPVDLRNTFGKLQIVVKVRVSRFDFGCAHALKSSIHDPRILKADLTSSAVG